MRILIVGLGSIGQRHLRVLKKLFKNSVKIFTLNSTKNKLIIYDNFKTKKVNSLIKFYKIEAIDINQVENYKIDVAFICNPPSLHIDIAIKLAKKNCNLFIEKPLAIETHQKKIKILNKIIKKRKLLVKVGYQLRYHPGIKIIRNIQNKKILGKVLGGYFHYGEFTGSTKKYEKFTNSIYVKKKLGGGVLLSFSHHLDLAIFLFGNLKFHYSFVKNTKNFNINTEDYCNFILKDKLNNSFFFNLNFLETPQNNFIILNYELGCIKFNFSNNNLEIKKFDKEKSKIYNFSNFKRNNMFEKQTVEFLNSVKNREINQKNLNENLKLLRLIDIIKKRSEK